MQGGLDFEETLATMKRGVANLPITYLGIPLGANPKKSHTWKPILEKVEKRFAMWKTTTLSKVGRLILIKACSQ